MRIAQTRSSAKLERASLLAARKPSRVSASLRAMRMPLPPPPAEALIITGYPKSRAMRMAASASGMMSRWPGTVETPAARASFFDSILSPIAAIARVSGPMNWMPARASASAKAAFSERNP